MRIINYPVFRDTRCRDLHRRFARLTRPSSRRRSEAIVAFANRFGFLEMPEQRATYRLKDPDWPRATRGKIECESVSLWHHASHEMAALVAFWDLVKEGRSGDLTKYVWSEGSPGIDRRVFVFLAWNEGRLTTDRCFDVDWRTPTYGGFCQSESMQTATSYRLSSSSRHHQPGDGTDVHDEFLFEPENWREPQPAEALEHWMRRRIQEMRRDDIAQPYPLIDEATGKGADLIRHVVKPGSQQLDRVAIAKQFLVRQINERLDGATDTVLLLDQPIESSMTIQPRSLLAAMYLLFAREIAGRQAPGTPCANPKCDRTISADWGRKYCDDRCRDQARYYRDRAHS